jgi:hypothetical protein
MRGGPMSKYFIFQVPYHAEESQFLLQVCQTAAQAHREYHERSTLAIDLQTDPGVQGASYILIKEEMDHYQSMPVLESLL